MKYTHFSRAERTEFSLLKSKGYSIRSIAKAMGRNHSSLVRELSRNKVNQEYEPKKADHKAYVKRKYSKYQGMKVRANTEIESFVASGMKQGWSPERIAGRFNFEKDENLLGKKAIYKYLYSSYGQSLCEHLKYKRYKQKKRKRIKSVREIIKDRVFIDERPEIINSRERFGDFEGDTMGRPKKASQETLVVVRERFSRKIFALKVKGLKYSMTAFKKIISSVPAKSITFDNGTENTRFKILKIATYFCDPYSPWQKGTVENGIGLIREYIPKKADLKDFSQSTINAILQKINDTPMKCLGFKTPNEIFNQNLLLLNQPKWCT
jgi:transposase, IS30 family